MCKQRLKNVKVPKMSTHEIKNVKRKIVKEKKRKEKKRKGIEELNVNVLKEIGVQM